MLPGVTVAMFRTSRILHSRGCIQVVHVEDDICFLVVPLRSDFGVGDIKFLQEGRHQDRVTHDVTGLPSLRFSVTYAAGGRHQ